MESLSWARRCAADDEAVGSAAMALANMALAWRGSLYSAMRDRTEPTMDIGWIVECCCEQLCDIWVWNCSSRRFPAKHGAMQVSLVAPNTATCLAMKSKEVQRVRSKRNTQLGQKSRLCCGCPWISKKLVHYLVNYLGIVHRTAYMRIKEPLTNASNSICLRINKDFNQ